MKNTPPKCYRCTDYGADATAHEEGFFDETSWIASDGSRPTMNTNYPQWLRSYLYESD